MHACQQAALAEFVQVAPDRLRRHNERRRQVVGQNATLGAGARHDFGLTFAKVHTVWVSG